MKLFTTLTLLAMSTLSVILFVGCETESANASIHISPSAATVREGQSITFTAEGGYDHSWSLANNTIGRLSTSTGNTAVYTATSGTNVQQTLTLTSTIDGLYSTNGVLTPGSSTYSQSASAIIHHL